MLAVPLREGPCENKHQEHNRLPISPPFGKPPQEAESGAFRIVKHTSSCAQFTHGQPVGPWCRSPVLPFSRSPVMYAFIVPYVSLIDWLDRRSAEYVRRTILLNHATVPKSKVQMDLNVYNVHEHILLLKSNEHHLWQIAVMNRSEKHYIFMYYNYTAHDCAAFVWN